MDLIGYLVAKAFNQWLEEDKLESMIAPRFMYNDQRPQAGALIEGQLIQRP
jgi:hypothetical protein